MEHLLYRSEDMGVWTKDNVTPDQVRAQAHKLLGICGDGLLSHFRRRLGTATLERMITVTAGPGIRDDLGEALSRPMGEEMAKFLMKDANFILETE